MFFINRVIHILLVLTSSCIKIILPLGLFVVILNMYVNKTTGGVLYSDYSHVPASQTALVLGARVYSDGRLSAILEDRVLTALDLYRQGKVKKFLLSADHSRICYDETNAMKNYLLEKGVPKEDIFLDHAGFKTYDSIYRSREIFEVDSMIIVTQKYHLPRALYMADNLGVNAVGFAADRQPYMYMRHYKIREVFANVKAFAFLLFKLKPTYLGEKIPITGNSLASWD